MAPVLKTGLFQRLEVKHVVLTLVTIFLIYQVVVPLFFLIWGSLKVVGPTDLTYFTPRITFANYVRIFSSAEFLTPLVNTLVYALGSTLLAGTFGVALALVVARTDAPLRGLMNALTYGQIIMPGLLMSIAWVFLASPEIGLLNRVYRDLTGAATPAFDLYSLLGMIWVMALDSFPLVYLTMVGTLRSMDPSLEEAAFMSGRTVWSTLRTITFPLMRPSLLAGIILVFIQAVESFEVPLIIGLPRKISVLSTEIYFRSVRTPVDFGTAAAFGVLLLVLALGLLAVYQRLIRHQSSYMTVSGKAFRPRVIALGVWRWPVALGVLTVLSLSVVAPTLVLLWASFLRFFQAPSPAAFKAMSFANYERVFASSTVQEGLRNSLILGAGSATVVILLVAVLAWMVYRTQLPGRRFLDWLAFAPRAVPAVLFAVSMLWLYLVVPLPIYGTLVILLLAYITRYMPVAMRMVSAGIVQIHRELEEAASTSGAPFGAVFFRVLLPLMRPVLVTAWIWVAIHAFRELSVSAILASPGSRTVAVAIYELWSEGSLGLIAAFSVLVLALLLVVTVGVDRIGRRFGIQGIE
ncbi:MAG: iron ABC transporter permease [Chloroflexi bacterium]|nr:iron ABC transporter permease [Chloroflexota bacterium]